MFRSNIPNLKIITKKDDIIVISEKELECLSNAANNGGRVKSDSIVNHHVHLDFEHTQLNNVLKPVKEEYSLSDSMIGLLTAVEMEDAVMINDRVNNINYTLIITAGISNPSAPILENTYVNDCIEKEKPGTINIILIIDGKLTEHALVNLFITITEAKTLLFQELNIRMKNGRPATGTSTDTIVVGFTGNGEIIEWSGYATEFGQSIGRNVYVSINKALKEKVNEKK